MNAITTDSTQWTVLALINWGSEYFASKKIESGRLNMELLLCHVMDCTRIQLYSNFDKPLLPEDLSKMRMLIKRRLAREPLQYILGTTEFMGVELRVDRRVLIPRPETELLVEEVILDAANSPRRTLLDIGTGSGNIAIAVARSLSDLAIDSVDISRDALSLAAENIRMHRFGDRITLLEGDIMNPDWKSPRSRYDVIVSNPPYVSAKEFDLLEPEIRHFEPAIATTDGSDGLSFYRTIAVLGKNHLAERGRIFLEIAYNQLEDVSAIFSQAGYSSIAHRNDYSGIPRCLMISRV